MLLFVAPQILLNLLGLQIIMQTATPGGRPSSIKASGGSGGGRSTSTAGSSGGSSAGDGLETLEQLSATALLHLLKLADAAQQVAALFQLLPLDDGTFPEDQEAGGGGAAGQSNSQAAGATTTTEPTTTLSSRVAAAVLPRLPQLQLCVERLMQNSCFKEANTCVECLLLLGKRLGSSSMPLQPQQQPGGPVPEPVAAAAGAADVPAHACLSIWAETALQQEEPEVKHVALARTLLDMYIRFHGMVVAAARTMC